MSVPITLKSGKSVCKTPLADTRRYNLTRRFWKFRYTFLLANQCFL